MLNLFSMERYRARRTKSKIITLLIMGLLSFFLVYASTIGTDTAGCINICQQFTVMMSNSMSLIFWAITISVYIAGEYKNGFVKSIAGQIPKRSYLVISKLLLFMLYTIEMFAVSFIFTSISAFVFSANNLIFGFSSEMIMIWIALFLLYIGFSCTFILIGIVTRNSSLGIGLGIFIGCGLSSLVYTGVSWLVNKSGIVSNFNLGNYMIDTNMQYMQVGIPQEYILKAIVIGLVFIVVTTFASAQVLNKRDI